ncbi:MAG: type II toxin-antitoxin system HicB family antitoxin [Deltaproteobacteria bacterium]|jgi:predicted RNase H-like HicB family nuclease|nr:type II toxin-antitoxin system HicB family antitoxin [Deltaproteobacteria bacterium]
MEEVKMKYPIALHKDDSSDYGVTIPDLPGCFSAGASIEEAIAMAQEAAECHIEGLLIDAEPIPVPSSVEEYKNNPDYQDCLWALIDIDLSKLSLKSKRINITLPERLLTTIDHYVRKCGESRSGLLAQAITEYMATHQMNGQGEQSH